MSCNCKKINTAKELEEELCKKNKLTWYYKTKVVIGYTVFQLFFTFTAISNFIRKNELKPSIPKRVLAIIDRFMNGKKL